MVYTSNLWLPVNSWLRNHRLPTKFPRGKKGKYKQNGPTMVTSAFYPSPLERKVKADGIQGPPGLQPEFQAAAGGAKVSI